MERRILKYGNIGLISKKEGQINEHIIKKSKLDVRWKFQTSGIKEKEVMDTKSMDIQDGGMLEKENLKLSRKKKDKMRTSLTESVAIINRKSVGNMRKGKRKIKC